MNILGTTLLRIVVLQRKGQRSKRKGNFRTNLTCTFNNS